MATKIDEAYVELTAKDAKLITKLRDAEKRMDHMRAAADKLKTALVSAFGGYATLRVMQRWIDLANTQIVAEQKLATVLRATRHAAGLTARELQSYASHLQEITGIGDEVTLSAMAMLATFKNIKGPVFKETISLAQDLSTVMGTNLQGAVVRLGKALNDPVRGLTALRRIGISFDDAQVRLVKNLVQSNQLLKAQAVILKELKTEMGGAAKAVGDTYYGSVKKLSSALSDLGEQLGKVLQRNLSPVVGAAAAGVGGLNRAGMFGANILDPAKISRAIDDAIKRKDVVALRGIAQVLGTNAARRAATPASYGSPESQRALTLEQQRAEAWMHRLRQTNYGFAAGGAVAHGLTGAMGLVGSAFGGLQRGAGAIQQQWQRLQMEALKRALQPPKQSTLLTQMATETASSKIGGALGVLAMLMRGANRMNALSAQMPATPRPHAGAFYGAAQYAQAIQGGISQAERDAAQRDKRRNALLTEMKDVATDTLRQIGQGIVGVFGEGKAE